MRANARLTNSKQRCGSNLNAICFMISFAFRNPQMIVYFLDRNLVIEIEKSLNFMATKHKHIDYARSLDRKNYFLSPMLSILEGHSKKPPSQIEIENGCRHESESIRNFYKIAKTDADYFLNQSDKFASSFKDDAFLKFEEIKPALMKFQLLLSDINSKNSCFEKAIEIMDIALLHDIGRTHPVVMCAIACSFGNLNARRVLKTSKNPTVEKAYNTFMDLKKISDISYIKSYFLDEPNSQCRLATADIPLRNLSKELVLTIHRKDLDIFERMEYVEHKWDEHSFLGSLKFIDSDKSRSRLTELVGS